jgi:hypothetical protein
MHKRREKYLLFSFGVNKEYVIKYAPFSATDQLLISGLHSAISGPMGFGRPSRPILKIPNFFLKNTENTLFLT